MWFSDEVTWLEETASQLASPLVVYQERAMLKGLLIANLPLPGRPCSFVWSVWENLQGLYATPSVTGRSTFWEGTQIHHRLGLSQDLPIWKLDAY